MSAVTIPIASRRGCTWSHAIAQCRHGRQAVGISPARERGHRRQRPAERMVSCANGYDVTCSRGEAAEPLTEVAADLEHVVVVPGDVSDPEHGQAVAAAARASFGGLDGVVLNAGIGNSAAAGDGDAEERGSARLEDHPASAPSWSLGPVSPSLDERRGSLSASRPHSRSAGRAPRTRRHATSKAGLSMLCNGDRERTYGPRRGAREGRLCRLGERRRGMPRWTAGPTSAASIERAPTRSRMRTCRCGAPASRRRSHRTSPFCSASEVA